jgi:hypothetical protein
LNSKSKTGGIIDVKYQILVFIFFEQKLSIFPHDSTYYPLYLLWRPEASVPPQKDIAAIGAKYLRLDFLKNFCKVGKDLFLWVRARR